MAEILAWLDRQPIWIRLIAMIALGGMAGLGHPPFDLRWLSVLAFAPVLIVLAHRPNAKSAGFYGWLVAIGYFGLSLSWIVEPFLVEPDRYGWMAPFALLFLSAGLGLFWAGAAALGYRLATGWRRIVMTMCLLAVVEYLRSVLFTGFPWALIGHIWVNHGIAQGAAWVGPHGLTLLALLPGTIAAALWAGRSAGIALSGLVIVIALIEVAGRATLAGLPNIDRSGPMVRLIQPNAPQDEKWDPELAPIFFERQLAYSADGDVPDLIVWPETSVPYFLEYAGSALEEVAEAARGAPVVLGVQRLERPRYFNSLALVGKDGHIQSLYDKSHLVPFGEYVPFAALMARLGIHGLAATEGGGFTAGTGAADGVYLPNIGFARPLICYEGIFAEEISQWTTRPRLLLLITNDAWFGERSGPYQHLAQAQLRAIEQGLPMVRVANTGISAMIDPYGRLAAQIPLGVAKYVDVNLPAVGAITVYGRFGDIPILLLLGFATLGFIFWPRKVIDVRSSSA